MVEFDDLFDVCFVEFVIELFVVGENFFVGGECGMVCFELFSVQEFECCDFDVDICFVDCDVEEWFEERCEFCFFVVLIIDLGDEELDHISG